MNYFEFSEAVKDAESTVRLADRAAGLLAQLLVGRLRKVDNRSALASLKRELRDFNLTTRKWK